MIKAVDRIDIEICKANSLYNPILCKIFSIYEMQRENFNCLLYNQLDEDCNVTAVILCFNGEINISLNSKADKDEIRDFLCAVGFFSVLSNVGLFEKINSGVSMKYTGKEKPHSNAKLLTSEDVAKCFDLIKGNFDIDISFDEWFVDMSHKIRHDKAVASYIGDEKILSLALGMYKTDFSVLITSVCTDKSNRNNGFASDCINKLINLFLCDNIREIFVFCEEKLVSFYENLEFEIDGSWHEYVRKI